MLNDRPSTHLCRRKLDGNSPVKYAMQNPSNVYLLEDQRELGFRDVLYVC